jgi:hypothetical protein
MLRLRHGCSDMMAIEKYAKSWWGVVAMMVAIALAATYLGAYADYLPDELADGNPSR